MMFDIVIKDGFVVDGSGAEGFIADVAIKDGCIAEIGRIEDDAKAVIDARGKVVAPGFIDPHTHFDAQILWDGAARPSLEHGVTSIVPGNCSLSLAPLRASDRPTLVNMFQQIEEMPPEAFTIAFKWTWEDFAGYRAAIEPTLQINVAPLVGHTAIRQWVMGAAANVRAASPDEVKAMQDLLRECLEAGAVGMSTSFIDVDSNGRPVPSRFAQFSELDALAAVLGEFGRMLQVVPEFYDAGLVISRIDQLAELSIRHNIPTTFSPIFDQPHTPDDAARQIARVEQQTARGARVIPQMQTRPLDLSFSLLRPSLFFAVLPFWYKILRQPLEARLTSLRDPATVARMIDEASGDNTLDLFGNRVDVFADLLVRGGDAAPPELIGRTLDSIAAERGVTSAEALISLSLDNGLDVSFAGLNRGHADSGRIGPFLAHPLVHIGASDAGAHNASFSTYGDTSYLFSEFVRKTRTFTLEEAVRKITAETADIWGLKDRGRLQPGLAADVVVFDADTMARDIERPVFDMPGNGMRYTRDGIGVEAVLVNGQVAYAGGAYTGATAGMVIT